MNKVAQLLICVCLLWGVLPVYGQREFDASSIHEAPPEIREMVKRMGHRLYDPTKDPNMTPELLQQLREHAEAQLRQSMARRIAEAIQNPRLLGNLN